MEEGEREVGKGEGDACGAGGDDIDAVTTVVGEGGAKIEGSVPVRVRWFFAVLTDFSAGLDL